MARPENSESHAAATEYCKTCNYINEHRGDKHLSLEAETAIDAFEEGAYWKEQDILRKAEEWFNIHVGIPYEVETNEDGEPLATSYIDYAKKRFEMAREMFNEFRKYVR